MTHACEQYNTAHTELLVQECIDGGCFDAAKHNKTKKWTDATSVLCTTVDSNGTNPSNPSNSHCTPCPGSMAYSIMESSKAMVLKTILFTLILLKTRLLC